jgi:sulfur-carrier protein adenylyltransferase/sulfurtransferase
MELNNDEIRRYSRHLILPEVGLAGQKKICATSVLCIGAGGLGSPIAMYLAAAGVGRLGIVDFDTVDYSNLQRQILHTDADVGRPKALSARETINGINPGVEVVLHNTRITSENALDLIRPYDIVVDGTDNFPTRYLTNDACVLLKKPNVYGSIFRFEGQASVFAPHLGGPCYRCLYPEPPPPGMVPSCAEGGVLGVLPGIVGCSPQTGHAGSRRSFNSWNFILSASNSSSRPTSELPRPMASLRISVAWMQPMMPGSTPNTPPSAQLGTMPGGGGSGYRQR